MDSHADAEAAPEQEARLPTWLTPASACCCWAGCSSSGPTGHSRSGCRCSEGRSSWAAVGKPPTSPVTSLAATPEGRSLVLGGPRGLYRSDDGGLTWRQVLTSRTVLATAISADGTVLAAVTDDTAFYRSDDGGLTWPGPP